MSDDLTKKKIDKNFISLKESYEVESWKKHFNVTESQLQEAGNSKGVAHNHPVKQVEAKLKELGYIS